MVASSARLSLPECEAIFYAALKAGDAESVVASLKIMATLDPRLAQALFDTTRLDLDKVKAEIEDARQRADQGDIHGALIAAVDALPEREATDA